MDRVIFKHHHVTERRAPGSDTKQSQVPVASVRLVREGAHVRAMEVLCACGERLTIELTYEAEDRPPSANPKP